MNKKVHSMDSDETQALLSAVSTLKLMANPHRLAILCHLGECEMSVGEIAEVVGLSQSALSQHLAKLRENSVVYTRREGQTIYYSLKSEETERIIKVLREVYCSHLSDKC